MISKLIKLWPIIVVVVGAVISLGIRSEIALADAKSARSESGHVHEEQHQQELRIQRVESAISVLRDVNVSIKELKDEIRRNNRR